MKKLIFFLFFLIPCISNAQLNTDLIIGTWKFDKIVNIDTSNKSSIKNTENAKGVEVVFKPNGDVSSTQLKAGKLEVFNGKYRFSEDKKYLYQDGIESKIIELNTSNLVLEINREVKIHFKRAIKFKETIKSAQNFIMESKITSAVTKEKIPNATIKNIVTNETTNANAEGVFKLKVNSTDSILITCIGYQNKTVCANDVQFVKEITLIENSGLLNEVVVNTNGKKTIVLNDFSNCGNYFLVSGGFQLQAAQSFQIEGGYTRLKGINICKEREHAKFRVWIYDVDTISGGPSTKLLEDIIIVKTAKRNVTINVEKYNVKIPNDVFFIAVEWLFEDENRYWEKQKSFNGVKLKVPNYEPGISQRINNNIDKNYTWGLHKNGKWHISRMTLLISAELSQ
jgi:hypothetical protein